jgi:hypothetical protein
MSKAIQKAKLGKVASGSWTIWSYRSNMVFFFYEKGGGSMPDLGVY